MRARVTSLLLFVLATAVQAAQTWRTPDVVLPLVREEGNIAVHAKLGGHPILLQFDTGTLDTLIDSNVLKRWKLAKNAKEGDSFDASLEIGPLKFDKRTFTVEDVMVSDEPSKADPNEVVSGLLGMDFLKDYAFAFDLPGHRLALWKGGKVDENSITYWMTHASPASDQKEWTPIIELADAKPMTWTLFNNGEDEFIRIKTLLNGKPQDLLVDTGTDYCTLNPSTAKGKTFIELGTSPIEGIGSMESLKTIAFENLVVGDLKREPIIFTINDEDDADCEGLFGMDALGSGKLVIDVPAQKMYFVEQHDPTASIVDTTLLKLGIQTVGLEEGKWVIVCKPNSPAYAAGARTGDALVGYGEATISEIYSSKDGRPDKATAVRLGKFLADLVRGTLKLKVEHKPGEKSDIEVHFSPDLVGPPPAVKKAA